MDSLNSSVPALTACAAFAAGAASSCSLDDPGRVPPEDNTRTSSRLSWIIPDGHPDHSEARDG
jgi:hypothetical protein